MKKILLIDNNIDPPYGCAEIREELEKAAAGLFPITVESARAPDSALPVDFSGIDGVVISGSKTRIFENAPWIEKEMDALRTLHRLKIPTLGICYGEQLMVRALAGEAFTGASKVSEYGWVRVDLTEAAKKSAIFASLPKSFTSFGFHSDEVYRLPSNFLLAAKSERCAVQAFDVLDAPMWGVQFHPERGLVAGNQGLDRRKKNNPEQEILGRDLGETHYDPQVAHHIFKNFLQQLKG